MPKKLLAIATIPFALALTACGEVEPLVLTPPASLLTCADEPPAPQLPARGVSPEVQIERDRLMLAGYLALRSAYGDCRSKVDGVRAWVAEVGR